MRFFLTTGLALVFFCANGCSSTKNSFTGKVTYKGQPVPGGSIVLHPKEGTQTYTGSIRPDGTFTVTDAALGTMVVTINNKWLKTEGTGVVNPPQGTDPKVLEKMMPKQQGAPQYVPIPEKYADPKTSPLIWEIKARNESKEFDLMD
ncbi:MAG TPA: hypothetical protein VKE98_08595 [Gemmataceae bacterium]|nr:hypothetical protein [Gemmataceae bacterium]